MTQVMVDAHELEKRKAQEEYLHTVIALEGAIMGGEKPTRSKLNASRRATLRLERAESVAVYIGGEFTGFEDKIQPNTLFSNIGVVVDELPSYGGGIWFGGSVQRFVEICCDASNELNPRESFDREAFNELADRLECHGFADIRRKTSFAVEI